MQAVLCPDYVTMSPLHSPKALTPGSKDLGIQSRPSPMARQQMWESKQVDRWCQQRLREMLVPATVQLDAGLGQVRSIKFHKGMKKIWENIESLHEEA